MIPIPETLYRASQVRELDRLAIEEYGTPGLQLMERAGVAAFQALRMQRPRATKMLVLCGTGNNGGDGYVIARLGLQVGMDVLVLSLASVDRLVGDALRMAEKYRAIQGPYEAYDCQDFSAYPLIVDAMLGTGFKGELRGLWAQAITALNSAQAAGNYVLSVDIPSGLNADTGHRDTVAVQANLTVTFIGVKQGLLTADGPQLSGRLLFDDLAVDRRVYQKVNADVHRLDDRLVKKMLPRRVKNSHKGSFGKLLVVGSNPPYFGAARLSAL
ncbi:MAG: NAD(P)H-hydrate epimerase, partial [Thiohalomonadales bacterium]